MLQIPAWSSGNELPQGDGALRAAASKSRHKLCKQEAQHADFSLSSSASQGVASPSFGLNRLLIWLKAPTRTDDSLPRFSGLVLNCKTRLPAGLALYKAEWETRTSPVLYTGSMSLIFSHNAASECGSCDDRAQRRKSEARSYRLGFKLPG